MLNLRHVAGTMDAPGSTKCLIISPRICCSRSFHVHFHVHSGVDANPALSQPPLGADNKMEAERRDAIHQSITLENAGEGDRGCPLLCHAPKQNRSVKVYCVLLDILYPYIYESFALSKTWLQRILIV
jgi:hypothetical protein